MWSLCYILKQLQISCEFYFKDLSHKLCPLLVGCFVVVDGTGGGLGGACVVVAEEIFISVI